jgi:arylsulfatase A
MKSSKLICLLALASMLTHVARAQQAPAKKPNIIFILADDLGFAELSCYGSDRYKTPNIDRLAKDGLRFTHAYAAPLCGPSRAVILTGRYPFRTGGTNQDACGLIKPEAETTIPTYLKQAGYITTMIGKFGQMSYEPADWGFDDYLRFQGSGIYWNTQDKGKTYLVNREEKILKDKEYMPDLMHNKLIDFITKNKDRPFFAYYALSHVHEEILPTPDSKPDSKNIYADNVVYMDKLVGKLRTELKRLKLDDNTILFFFSDNGTAHQEAANATIGGRRLIGQKGSMEEGGSLEPLIAYWPGVTPAGKLCTDLISSTDLLTTFADIVGASLPKDKLLDGQSFNAQLHGQKGIPRKSLFVQLANNYWVRNDQWKLDQSGVLYDMSKAPFEEILVPVDSQNQEAAAARASLQKELDRLNPAGGYKDTGDGSGRHANKVEKEAKKAAKKLKQNKDDN